MKNVRIFYNKKDTALFLLYVLVFAVLFVLIYKPLSVTGLVGEGGYVGSWPTQWYLVFLVGLGYVMLSLSHAYLYIVTKARPMRMAGYVAWAFFEVTFIAVILGAISKSIRPEEDGVSSYMLFFRVWVDVISILVIPYVLATLVVLLRKQSRQIEYLTALNSLQGTVEQKPVSSLADVLNFDDRSGRFAFSTRREDVLYVESADNYCNIHYINEGKESYFILHNSLTHVSKEYADQGIIRCHRCYLINKARVKAVKRTRDGLVVELTGSENVIPVSKTYAESVLEITSE